MKARRGCAGGKSSSGILYGQLSVRWNVEISLPFLPHPLETEITEVDGKPFGRTASNLLIEALGTEEGEKLSDRSTYWWRDRVGTKLTKLGDDRTIVDQVIWWRRKCKHDR